MADVLLEIVEGRGAGTEIPLDGPIELGRDPKLPHPLNDSEVSRRHARLVPSGGGAKIEDLSSTNGTFANDQPIEGVRDLTVGDRIRVGLTVLELRSRQQATVTGSAVAPVPELTRVGAEVLRPAAERELAPVVAAPVDVPLVRMAEREPEFIQASAVQVGLGAASGEPVSAGTDPKAVPDDADALARLVDTRVKHQTGVAAFAVLALAALAVLIFLVAA